MHKRHYLTFALAGTLFATPLGAFAQSAPGPAQTPMPGAAATDQTHRGHGGAMRQALAGLDLSADQKSRIKDMMKSYRDSRNTASPETRQALRAQIEGVLTLDQRTRFTTEMERARAQGRAERAPQPAPTS